MRAQILTLLTLLLLVSCGAQKTATTLNISSGFALAANNTTFNGGLIISGKMVGSDKAFSYSIPRNTGAGNQVTIELPKGQWNFYAAGWKYSSGGDRYFTNDVYCGTASADLNSNSASVDINIAATNCDSSTFASSRNNTDNPSGIKTFRLSSCMTFYNDATNDWITSSTSADYCDSAVPLDMKSKVNSFKVTAPNRTLNNQFSTGFSSNCIQREESSLISPPTTLQFRLPTNNIPFVVDVYEDNSCNKKIASYPMHEGMEFSYSSFDKMLLSTTTSANISLHLPSSQFRRGKSPFYTLLPSFQCSDAFCAGSGNTYEFMLTATDDMIVTVEHDTSLNCSDYILAITTSSLVDLSWNYTGTGTGTGTGNQCIDDGDKIQYKFRNIKSCSTTGAGSGTSPCATSGASGLTFSLTRTGTTTPKIYDVYVANPTGGGAELGMLDRAWRATGAAVRPKWGGNNIAKDDNNKYYGALSNVRDMLGPDGVGGVFGDYSSCSSATGTRTAYVNDDGVLKTFQATISSVSTSWAYLFCSTTSPYNSTCENPFQKKITISELVSPGAYELRHVITINCSSKVGKMHELHEEIDEDANERHERKIVLWNTQTSSTARAEEYSYEKVIDPTSSQLISYHARMNRIFKGTSDNYYFINGMEYHFKKDSDNFDENFNRYFYVGYTSSNILTGKDFPDSVTNQPVADYDTLNVFTYSGAVMFGSTYYYDLTSFPSTGASPVSVNPNNFSSASVLSYSSLQPGWTSYHSKPVEYGATDDYKAHSLIRGDFDTLLDADSFFAP